MPKQPFAKLQRLAIAADQIHQSQVCLTPAQQHYLRHVLRLRLGDSFIAMENQGQSWLARLERADQKPVGAFQATLLEPIDVPTELPVAVTLIAALPKGTGFETVIPAAVELGVACIAPALSDRTLLNPSPQKLERWRRIVREAAEQSERAMVPDLLDPVPFAACLEHGRSSPLRYLCVARGQVPHLIHSLQWNKERLIAEVGRTAIAIATGPEGGWTEAEVNYAIAAGYRPVSLGQRILRSITAPLVALSLIAAVFETPDSKSPID